MSAKLRPTKFWFWLGGLLIASGVIGGIAIASSAFVVFSGTIDNFARVSVPNTQGCRLTFDKPGKYRMYYEYQGTRPTRDAACEVTGEESFTASSKPPLGLTVTLQAPNGDTVTPQRAEPTETMKNVRHSGVSIGDVEIAAAGDYSMSVQSAGEESFVVALGIWPTLRMMQSMAIAFGTALAGVAIGLTMIFVARSKRRKRRIALQSQYLELPPPIAQVSTDFPSSPPAVQISPPPASQWPPPPPVPGDPPASW